MTINDCDALLFLFVFGASYVPEIDVNFFLLKRVSEAISS